MADMRVVAEDATFGIFCRRFGVPLIDLGTIRLPRLIGHSQAIDLILTGRPVGALKRCASAWPTVWCPRAKPARMRLRWRRISRLPQTCLRADRLSHCGSGIWKRKRDCQRNARGARGHCVRRNAVRCDAFASGAGRHGAFGGSKPD